MKLLHWIHYVFWAALVAVPHWIGRSAALFLGLSVFILFGWVLLHEHLVIGLVIDGFVDADRDTALLRVWLPWLANDILSIPAIGNDGDLIGSRSVWILALGEYSHQGVDTIFKADRFAATPPLMAFTALFPSVLHETPWVLIAIGLLLLLLHRQLLVIVAAGLMAVMCVVLIWHGIHLVEFNYPKAAFTHEAEVFLMGAAGLMGASVGARAAFDSRVNLVVRLASFLVGLALLPFAAIASGVAAVWLFLLALPLLPLPGLLAALVAALLISQGLAVAGSSFWVVLGLSCLAVLFTQVIHNTFDWFNRPDHHSEEA
ncbi:hypothetical protein RXV86_21965 [Alisedimentitalea sp. MJ-SS2]|uniref:hypothetical protein n=1 Tax=Aliisedimentitalea sp. MJ-SS2 TaxID=3049795 RepID=UPI00290D66DE|nr:hypothetical protein [Alisedimentitalea sp. MJ-SS2]MDU8930062.1 hypothetical protein [Alisedimentitalea sp. MJ-SS2]